MTRKRWRNPDKRMAQAVELRQKGWSLRRIGSELAVGKSTVERDLARYDREQGEGAEIRPQLRVVRSPVPFASHRAVPSGRNGTPERDGNGTVEEAG